MKFSLLNSFSLIFFFQLFSSYARSNHISLPICQTAEILYINCRKFPSFSFPCFLWAAPAPRRAGEGLGVELGTGNLWDRQEQSLPNNPLCFSPSQLFPNPNCLLQVSLHQLWTPPAPSLFDFVGFFLGMQPSGARLCGVRPPRGIICSSECCGGRLCLCVLGSEEKGKNAVEAISVHKAGA